MEKIERWKLLADELFTEGKSVYIKDDEDNLYFCNIVLVGENKITVDCFAPEQRAGERKPLRWLRIVKFVEYEKEGVDEII